MTDRTDMPIDGRIEIHNLWSELIVMSTDAYINDLLKEIVMSATSYQKANWEYANKETIAKAKRSGDADKLEWALAWDGKIPLAKELYNGVRFPTGLINMVCERIRVENIRISHEDLRTRPKIEEKIGTVPSFVPRPYQIRALNAALHYGRGIIKLPTGSGKTVIAGMIIAHNYLPTLILVHKVVLIDQWINTLHEVADLKEGDVGVIQGSIFEPSFITIASVDTLKSWLRQQEGLKFYQKIMEIKKTHPGGFKQIIFDEVHGYGSDKRYEVAMELDAYFRYGLSATPTDRTEANARVHAITGNIIIDIPIEPLQNDGFLSKMDIKFHPVPRMYFDYNDRYPDVYRQAITHHDFRNKHITDLAISKALEGKKVLIFVDYIEHGELLEAILQSKEVLHVDNYPGAEAAFIHGTHKLRDKLLEAFKLEDSTINILIATEGMIGEGFDYKELDVVIIANGGKGAIRSIQKIGRGQRIAERKKKCEIHDYADCCKYLMDHAKIRYNVWLEIGYIPDVSEVPYLV